MFLSMAQPSALTTQGKQNHPQPVNKVCEYIILFREFMPGGGVLPHVRAACLERPARAMTCRRLAPDRSGLTVPRGKSGDAPLGRPDSRWRTGPSPRLGVAVRDHGPLSGSGPREYARRHALALPSRSRNGEEPVRASKEPVVRGLAKRRLGTADRARARLPAAGSRALELQADRSRAGHKAGNRRQILRTRGAKAEHRQSGQRGAAPRGVPALSDRFAVRTCPTRSHGPAGAF